MHTHLQHESQHAKETRSEQMLNSETSAFNSRMLVSTLVVGAAAGTICSAVPAEVPQSSELFLPHEVLFAGILVFAFLSMSFSIYGILTLEFFGNKRERIRRGEDSRTL